VVFFAIAGPLSWLYLTVFLWTDYDLDINVRRPWRLCSGNKMRPVRSNGFIWAIVIGCVNSVAILTGSGVHGLSE